jgi:ribose-phosphate pyrophosphokinase
MIRPLVFALPGNEAMADSLCLLMGAERGELETRQFPDGEAYIRFVTNPANRSVILVCTLDHPDPKFLRLAFAAAAARDLGALRVGLVAPYLAYMRQDKRFQAGEAVTSRTFAALLSSAIDWLVTVDPHLHRYPSLNAIYTRPAQVVPAAPAIAAWIRTHVPQPFIIGPDVESEQWVAEVAQSTHAPYRVLSKERRGDRDVQVTVPDLQLFAARTPIVIDDIISSGETMLATLRHLRAQSLPPALCVGVHALFSDNAYASLRDLALQVVTTNAVPHASNDVDIAPAIADAAAVLAQSTREYAGRAVS